MEGLIVDDAEDVPSFAFTAEGVTSSKELRSFSKRSAF